MSNDKIDKLEIVGEFNIHMKMVSVPRTANFSFDPDQQKPKRNMEETETCVFGVIMAKILNGDTYIGFRFPNKRVIYHKMNYQENDQNIYGISRKYNIVFHASHTKKYSLSLRELGRCQICNKGQLDKIYRCYDCEPKDHGKVDFCKSCFTKRPHDFPNDNDVHRVIVLKYDHELFEQYDYLDEL